MNEEHAKQPVSEVILIGDAAANTREKMFFTTAGKGLEKAIGKEQSLQQQLTMKMKCKSSLKLVFLSMHSM